MKCINEAHGENWSLYNGDCCEAIKGLPDNSIDLCVHSPPFSSLYIYSDSEADMGNCKDDDEFIEHYKYLIGELYRVTVTGRLCVVHCKDLPKYANRDDTAGLKDFPGMIVDAFESAGWSYHSHVTIWKCPVTERERTNNNGLLHKTVLRDRSQLRQGMADFLKVFRKPPQGTLLTISRSARKAGFRNTSAARTSTHAKPIGIRRPTLAGADRATTTEHMHRLSTFGDATQNPFGGISTKWTC